jgi:copper chaperone CopZ
VVQVPQLLVIIIACLRKVSPMTAVEVVFRYGMPPGEQEMSALGQVSDVYGIRRIQFNEPGRTIRVEYDATRLNEATIENLLRTAGFDVREKLALI